jgi:hypothetical protein
MITRTYTETEIQGQLIDKIQENMEWLETTEGDEIASIGIEELEGILTRFLNIPIKLTIEYGKEKL